MVVIGVSRFRLHPVDVQLGLAGGVHQGKAHHGCRRSQFYQTLRQCREPSTYLALRKLLICKEDQIPTPQRKDLVYLKEKHLSTDYQIEENGDMDLLSITILPFFLFGAFQAMPLTSIQPAYNFLERFQSAFRVSYVIGHVGQALTWVFPPRHLIGLAYPGKIDTKMLSPPSN